MNAQNPVLAGSFQAAFAGGNSQPSLLQVRAGETVSTNIVAAAGTSRFQAPFLALGIAGAEGDFQGVLTSRYIAVASGQSVDILIANTSSGPLAENNIQI